MIVYGIPNCNTVKKALDWLKAHQIEFTFHDYKKKGISKEKLQEWESQVGWEALINKRGTTWKQLPPEVQAEVKNKEAAFELIIQKPSVTKRPLIESNNQIILGFDEQDYSGFFKK